MKQAKQKGFTLVELGIVLALIGLGLFFAISKLQETSATTRAQSAASELSFVVTNIRRLYSTQAAFPANWNNATMRTLIDNDVFPKSWVNAAGTNLAGGPFGAAPTFATVGTEVDMTIGGSSAASCREFVRLAANGYNRIAIGAGTGTEVKAPGAALNQADALTQCNSDGGPGNIVLRFART